MPYLYTTLFRSFVCIGTSPKNLDEILGMVKHANSLLDLRALFVGCIR